MEGEKQSVRVQTSVLNGIEKKALVSMASKTPEWVTSDMLTWVGLLGAVIAAFGYALSNLNLNWLWLTYLGIVMNWFGDSMDGTLARVRKQQRPVYGFYLDHNIDGITLTIVCIGAGLSNMVHFSLAMLVLAVYLLLSIYTYINIDLKGEHILTFGKMGPTEVRLIARKVVGLKERVDDCRRNVPPDGEAKEDNVIVRYLRSLIRHRGAGGLVPHLNGAAGVRVLPVQVSSRVGDLRPDFVNIRPGSLRKVFRHRTGHAACRKIRH